MSDDKQLFKSIYELSECAEHVNEYSDRIRENLIRIDEYLGTLKLGITVTSDKPIGYDDEDEIHYLYFNNSGIWAINQYVHDQIRDRDISFKNSYEVKFMSRNLLLAVIKNLPSFMKKVIHEAKKIEEALKIDLDRLDAWVNQIQI